MIFEFFGFGFRIRIGFQNFRIRISDSDCPSNFPGFGLRIRIGFKTFRIRITDSDCEKSPDYGFGLSGFGLGSIFFPNEMKNFISNVNGPKRLIEHNEEKFVILFFVSS